MLFTGGEPLLCDHIEALARRAKGIGFTVHLATNGLGLGRAASWLGDAVDEVFVSFEGASETHDRVRGSGMARRLRAAMGVVAQRAPRPRLVARCTLSATNASGIEATVATARELGFDAVSFLPVDTATSAFGGRPEERRALRPSASQIAALRRGILYLSAAGELGAFVLEAEERLMSLADALEETADRVLPRCNAPEWSVVVEAEGAMRPCFFQPVVTGVRGLSLPEVRRSDAWQSALADLGPGDATCSRCVCPKYIEHAPGSFAERAARRLGVPLPTWTSRTGAA